MAMKVSAQAARWGLLMTTVVLGATLVGTGVTTYLGARSTAAAVTETIASDTLSAVRAAIIDAASFDQQTIAGIVQKLQPSGVRYVAVTTPNGTTVAGGTPPTNASLPESSGVRSSFDRPIFHRVG